MSEAPPRNAVRGRLIPGGLSLEIGNSQRDAGGDRQRVQLTERIALTPAAARHLAVSLEEALARAQFDAEAAGGAVADRVTPRGRTPVHAESSAAVEHSTRLMNAVAALEVPYQHERSVRLTPGGLDGNRYLLTCDLADLGASAFDRILGVVEPVGFPAALRDAVRAGIPAAACVHFGFEEQAGRISCKLYLEQALDFEGLVRGAADPVLLHRAWKWQPQDGSWVETRYLWHPALAAQALADRVAAVYADPALHGGAFIRRVLEIALGGVAADRLMFLAVSESGNPRDSFDLNFYAAGLAVRALQRELFTLRDRFAIPPGRFQALYDQIRMRQLGHIAGGVHRNGEEFVTIYYGVAGYPRFNARLGG